MNPQKRIAHARWLLTTLLLCHAILLRAQQGDSSYRISSVNPFHQLLTAVRSLQKDARVLDSNLRSAFKLAGKVSIDSQIVPAVVPDFGRLQPNIPKKPAQLNLFKLPTNNQLLQFSDGIIQAGVQYRSFLDTPFFSKDLVQDFEQVQGNLWINGKLPFSVAYFGRHSNNRNIPNIDNFSISFNTRLFEQLAVQQQFEELRQRYAALDRKQFAADFEGSLKKLTSHLDLLGTYLNEEALKAQYIKAKENLAFQYELSPSAQKDALLKASQSFIEVYEGMQERYHKIKTAYEKDIAEQLAAIETKYKRIDKLLVQAPSSPMLLDSARRLIAALGGDTFQQKLAIAKTNIEKLNIGRAYPQQSSLSMSNTAIVGVNVAGSKGKFFSELSAGFLDNSFRNMVSNASRITDQYCVVATLGYGQRNVRELSVNGFLGRRYISNSFVPRDLFTIYGVSVQARQTLFKYHQLGVEIAESGGIRYTSEGAKKDDRFQLGKQDNIAVSLNYRAYLPQWGSRITGVLKYIGLNYASFSTVRSGTSMQSYQLKLEQELWRKHIKISAGISRNNFENPLLATGFNSENVFTTMSVSFRKRNWPSISLSYMPISVVTYFDNTLFENQYQTLNVNANHQYAVGIAKAQTNVLYNKVENANYNPQDTFSFTESLLITQAVNGKHTDLEAGFQTSSFGNLRFYEMSGRVGYHIAQDWQIGVGCKIAKLGNSPAQTGWSLRLELPTIFGTSIQAGFENSFFPYRSGSLRRLDIGFVGIRRRI
jgi:hypothetical protein